MRLVDEAASDYFARPRFARTLVSGFSLIALLIASVGIYGMMSYRVVQQSREIGIRLALGATPSTVLSKVLTEGMVIIGAGLVVGTAASLAFAQIIRSLLYETNPRDPVAFATVALVLALVGLLACWLPARCAAKVDPMVALRSE
jgi:ABC-type antimicrobial peptide transport system permease subunit